MARRTRYFDSEESTREITGLDATMDEAEIGDAGNGADPFGADLSGGPPAPLEEDPSEPGDILPDQIRRFPQGASAAASEEEEEGEPTAQPREPMPLDLSEI